MSYSRQVLLVLVLSGACDNFVWARGRLPPSQPMTFQAWVTYFRGPEGFQDLERSSGALDEISIFALQFDSAATVVPASPWVNETLSQFQSAQSRPSRLWLTIVNDVRDGGDNVLKDPGVIHKILATGETRTRHIEELLPWSKSVDGLDIDYESLKREDGESFSLFIEELAKRLHARGKYLSVTVEPKTDRIAGDQARAFDWKRIGAAADEVRVMAYFYHSPRGAPGPIAPLVWLSDLARFALKEVPARKLTVALTVNGLDWPLLGVARGIRFNEIEALMASHELKPHRDPADQSPYVRYVLDNEIHEVWFEDLTSLQAKIQQLRREGIRSIIFWQLGSGDPAFWTWLSSANGEWKGLRNSAKSAPPIPPSRRN